MQLPRETPLPNGPDTSGGERCQGWLYLQPKLQQPWIKTALPERIIAASLHQVSHIVARKQF